MQINVDRVVRDGFKVTEGWSETEISHRTNRLRLAVVFPKARHCQQMSLIEKNAGRVMPLELNKAELLPNGRQRVIWETTKPVLFETYAMKWVW